MPALSKKQQRFMGMVHALNKGEIKPSDVSKDVQDVAKDMKKKDAKDFASTKHKGLPMKKEVLNKLKEMIRQELSEYTYGTGDVVKDVNPSCPHYGAMGKVKSVNPRSVVFVVMNKGKNFKPGMELEKSHDQMKKMNESINEFSMKLQKSTQDMVDALLKVKSPMPKEIESALIMMAKGYGLDYVKREVKKDAKGFYKNLKQMAAAFPEFKNKPKNYKFESIIQERNDEVQTGKDYTKLWLQSLNLIMKQANNLKGALAKHPVKRDLNKLKAVETLFKRFIKPAIETERASSRHYAPNQTELKKYLSNSKFKVSVRILRQTIQSSNGYNENSWWDLDDKTTKLIKRIASVLYDIENKMERANLENINEKKKMFPPDKMTPKQAKEYKRFIDYAKMGIEYKIDMSLFESINEDGHTDVASSKRKVMIMVDDSNKLLNKLNGMNKEDSLPSWWSDKITLSQSYLSKATDFLLNPVESVNENLRPSDKKILMVIATELVKTQMKGKNKNKIRKELPDILSTMGTNDFSKKSPTNRFNKNKMISLGKGFDKLSDSDKKVFINTLMYNAGLAESVNEGKGVDKIMKIVDTQSFGKLAGQTVDTLSASLFKQVYDKASQGAKDKINQMNERQLLVFMNKLWMRFGKGLSGQMMS